MAGTLGSLVVDIGADVARLRADMGKATKTVGGATKRIEALANKASRSMKGIGAGLAAAFSVRGFSRFLTSTADATDQVGKLAQRLGITTESVSRLQFVASQSGISFGTMRGSLERLGKRAALAADGNQAFAAAFAMVGLNAEEFVNLGLDEQLLVVAEAVNKAQGSSQKLAAVSRILGDESRALIQAFGGGAEGIKKLNDRADELGITVSELQAKVSAEFNDAWDEATRVLASAGREIATTILPSIQKLATLIRDVGVPAVKSMANAFELLTGDEVKEAEQSLARVERRLDALRSQRDRVADIQKTRREGLLGFLADPEEQKAELDKHDANIKRLEGIRDRLIAAEKDRPKPPPTAAPAATSKKTDAQTTAAVSQLGKLQEQAQKTIEALDKQQATLGFTAEQMTVYEASVLAAKLQNQDLANQLVATAESATQASAEFQKMEDLRAEAEVLRESLKTPFDATADSLDRYDLLLEKNLITMDEWAEATNKALGDVVHETDEVAEQADKIDEAWGEMGATFTNAFGEAIESGAKLSDVLKSLGKEIASLLAKELSSGGFSEQLSGFFGGSGGSGGSGGGIFDFLGSLFGGGKAVGGSVRAGKFYAVGEAGPELFAPGVSGQIISNDNLPEGKSVNNFGITINGVGDRVDTASASQFATRIAQDLQRQLRRNT